MDDYINLPLLGKLLVVAVLAPAWWPVIKELWKEIDASLVEEGGVFGEIPTEKEARKLSRQRRISGESLISVPLGQGKRSGVGPKRTPTAGKAGPRQPAPKRRGF